MSMEFFIAIILPAAL